VVFIADPTQVKVAPLSGGVVRTLSNDGRCCPRWGSDGFIYYQSQSGNVNRVRAEGGAVESVTERDSVFAGNHADFQVLPDGDLGVFTAWGPPRIVAQRLSTGERKVLVPGMRPFVTRTGHLVFASLEGQILAANFDAGAMELTSAPTPLVEGVAINGSPYPLYTVSESGDLLYVTGTANVGTGRSLVWVDRDSREEPIEAPLNEYLYPRISPDGRRVALDTRGEDGGIWIWNFDGETLMRLILGDGSYEYPVWTPNGERLAYGGGVSAARDLHWKASNNTGDAEILAEAPGREGLGGLSPYFFTPDGAAIVFRDQANPETLDDLIMISLEADAPVVWRLNGDFTERNAELSPDGRWMAYASDESGVAEIYVRPFPQVEDDQVLVSNNGGNYPLWSRDGSELFYLQPGFPSELIAVSLDTDETDGSFAFRDREVVMEWPYLSGAGGRSYDVSPDGQRFLAIMTVATAGEGETTGQAILVQNWFEELRQRVGN
jgi:serine/threonine-protein kinase